MSWVFAFVIAALIVAYVVGMAILIDESSRAGYIMLLALLTAVTAAAIKAVL